MLSRDALGVVDATGEEVVPLAGRDWGAAVTWDTLLAHPERVTRGVTVNVPHPAVFQEHLRGTLSQLRKSYGEVLLAFQLDKSRAKNLRASGADSPPAILSF